MFTNGKLMFLYSESPVHPGAGDGVGAIDLPVQRERITGWPIIHASGIKGSMRDHFEMADAKNPDKLFAVFGPDANKKDKAGNPGNPDKNAGAIAFSDARTLLFPVRSLKGVFSYVTCPLALTRLKRDMEILDALGGNYIDEDFNEFTNSGLISQLERELDEEKILLANSANLLVIGSGNQNRVVLEELAFQPLQQKDLQNIPVHLAKWLQAKWQNGPWLDLSQRISLVSNSVFQDFVEFSTEVITRIRIDDEKGIVEEGALWNEECLPREMVMYSLVTACGALVEHPEDLELETGEKVMNYVTANQGITPRRIWIGGDVTIGRGIMQLGFV